jgi:hypothetical protein
MTPRRARKRRKDRETTSYRPAFHLDFEELFQVPRTRPRGGSAYTIARKKGKMVSHPPGDAVMNDRVQGTAVERSGSPIEAIMPMK